jgi:hypothetical protein
VQSAAGNPGNHLHEADSPASPSGDRAAARQEAIQQSLAGHQDLVVFRIDEVVADRELALWVVMAAQPGCIDDPQTVSVGGAAPDGKTRRIGPAGRRPKPLKALGSLFGIRTRAPALG